MTNQRNPDGSFVKITEIFAFIAKDGIGEGIVGLEFDGLVMPAIGANLAMVERIKEKLDEANVKYEIRHFKLVEEKEAPP